MTGSRNKRMKAKNGNKMQPHAVRIEFQHEQAQAVCVAGTFNEWRPGVTPMLRREKGQWIKELALPPGRYEYLLVVDRAWVTDPSAPDQAPNPYGGNNSVLLVGGEQ